MRHYAKSRVMSQRLCTSTAVADFLQAHNDVTKSRAIAHGERRSEDEDAAIRDTTRNG